VKKIYNHLQEQGLVIDDTPIFFFSNIFIFLQKPNNDTLRSKVFFVKVGSKVKIIGSYKIV